MDTEGLDIWAVGDAEARRAKVDETLVAVGLDPESARAIPMRCRWPPENSCG